MRPQVTSQPTSSVPAAVKLAGNAPDRSKFVRRARNVRFAARRPGLRVSALSGTE